ncbi:D-alanyl-D-alanine carboxypeptidase/D-alanyl-D-alanine endopeptidase [Adhaeribacter radiodurans]|uniref:D-alanyl-D-alanine carboxypeptidase/D-alanyl-D-alanine-endopeptidase n=1 Tax=Adhaeribacter radiodurans TaxID=2745197 RepID=A0A7L7L857_9BACT|nr:D-alanyl-D-alanine carboxypeptidase/D-alanyl-D-alanine-endopeptidase [Adhaeribacter radiodurans]QMU28934.1 D-alanyl-D-alanine carboxypeptidase/D-alanyl-D-alanine-endopeptidase [Adhaeribacter radiodurans]
MLPFHLRVLLVLFISFLPAYGWSQAVAEKLNAAYKKFANDPQLRNATLSLYVVDATTGKIVLDKNGRVGMVPASTQKVITSVSAYELLGKNFQFQTQFALSKNKEEGRLLIVPSGDPTLGSWRWAGTSEQAIIKKVSQAIQKEAAAPIREVRVDTQGWEGEAIPDGWVWQDIGNYYGAGSFKLNWHENQFDVFLKSGKNLGNPVSIASIQPALYGYSLHSELIAAAPGTGDKAFIYFPLNAPAGVIRGTIPINQSNFKISGALPQPMHQFIRSLLDSLGKEGGKTPKNVPIKSTTHTSAADYAPLCAVVSPPLDSIIFWLNRKSINLYSEALVKSLAYKNKKVASTESGLEIIRNYWKQRNIPESELNMVDGSGLSPLNRITAHAQVSILQHALQQTWFKSFYASLPQLNNMKMKSGTIHGVKGFCGYHTSSNKHQYVFSFLVNNYNGSSPEVVQKMYNVLNCLK